MFDRLQDRLSRTFRNLRGLGKIRESNIQEALSEVRKSLLEADVQYRVVQSFIDSVRHRALGEEVVDQVQPGQQFIKVVNDELVRLLGGETVEIPAPVSGRTFKILLMGLQGSGKTTSAVKLARFLRDQKKYLPVCVAADTARPAAKEQLQQFGKNEGIPVYTTDSKDAVAISKSALKAVKGKEVAGNCIIFDTAGRLAIDEDLMAELKKVKDVVEPDLVLYVLDSMAGQDAVRSAETFHQNIDFDGVVITKLDGDARGGAALSVQVATGRPIYFVGLGEKATDLEVLHPDRMASRILGMGDVVSFVEKAQEIVDVEQAEKLAKKLRKDQFTIEDFADQMKALEKMGSLESLVGMIPGGGQLKKAMASGMPQEEMKRIDAMIKSMTPRERRNHQIINGSRRKRIADGSGNTVQDLNRFLKQFLQAKKMMSRMAKGGMRGLGKGGLFSMGS